MRSSGFAAYGGMNPARAGAWTGAGGAVAVSSCTAEPVWAFEKTVARLCRRWCVFQVVYDGREPVCPGDFTSVEQTVDETAASLKRLGVGRLDAAYGCSLSGACLTRFLALGVLSVSRAILDDGITP